MVKFLIHFFNLKEKLIKAINSLQTARCLTFFFILYAVFLRLNRYLDNRSFWLDGTSEGCMTIHFIPKSFNCLAAQKPLNPDS